MNAPNYILFTLFIIFLFQGAFAGICVGVTGGVIRMILDAAYPEPPCYEEDNRPTIIRKVHYMYAAMILFFVTMITAIFISILTPPDPEYRVSMYFLFGFGFPTNSL